MAKKSRSKADNEFIDTLKMLYDYNYIKMHNWIKNKDYPHKKIKMILMKNVNNASAVAPHYKYNERYIIANEDYSKYYNNIIWYESMKDAIYIKVLMDSEKYAQDNKEYIKFMRLNPTDLSIEYSFESVNIDFMIDGCALRKYENISIIYNTEESKETKDEYIIKLYTLKGSLIKEVKYTKDEDKQQWKRIGVLNNLLDSIKKITDTKLVIKDETFEFDLDTMEVVSSEPWGLYDVCTIYDIGINKDSLIEFENMKTTKLKLNFTGKYYTGIKNDSIKATSIILNKYTGNFFISRDKETFYMISYKEMPCITGDRIVEILEFIGSETALQLVKLLRNLPEDITDFGTYLDVIKVGKTPLENIYSDAKILNKSGNRLSYSFADNKNIAIINDLVNSIRYFIKDRKNESLSFNTDFEYDADIVSYDFFREDVNTSLKLREQRIRSDKNLEDLTDLRDTIL